MEVLCVCNTNYQLIVATQMALTIKKNDNVSILLSIFIKGSEEIYKRIQQEGLFKNVFLLKIDDIYNTKNVAKKYKRVKTHLQELKYSIFGSDLGIFEKHIKFDEIIYFNPHGFMQFLYVYFKRKNKRLQINQYEEGPLCYTYKHTIRDKWINKGCKLRKLFGGKDFITASKIFYCFNPERYCNCLQPKQIPKIENNADARIREILFNVYLKDKKVSIDNKKYIFFPSVYDVDFKEPLGEIEIAKILQDILGDNNLLIKVHPRDNPERFIKRGFKVIDNTDVPWEVFQLWFNFEGKIFFTVLSGSVLTINSILEKPIPTYFLYKLLNTNSNKLATLFSETLQDFVKKDFKNLKFVKIIENKDELKREFEK